MQLHHMGGEQDAQPADEPAETARGEDVLLDAAALSFRYGHPAATVTPSKVTATQLKGRELDQEIAEGAPPCWHELTPEKPRFMQEAQGLSAAERGTAMHLVMQYLDLSASSGDDVRSQVAALAQRRLLTAEQAASLDIPALVRFFVLAAGGAHPPCAAGVAGVPLRSAGGWRYLRPVRRRGGAAAPGRGGLRVRDGARPDGGGL